MDSAFACRMASANWVGGRQKSDIGKIYTFAGDTMLGCV